MKLNRLERFSCWMKTHHGLEMTKNTFNRTYILTVTYWNGNASREMNSNIGNYYIFNSNPNLNPKPNPKKKNLMEL